MTEGAALLLLDSRTDCCAEVAVHVEAGKQMGHVKHRSVIAIAMKACNGLDCYSAATPARCFEGTVRIWCPVLREPFKTMGRHVAACSIQRLTTTSFQGSNNDYITSSVRKPSQHWHVHHQCVPQASSRSQSTLHRRSRAFDTLYKAIEVQQAVTRLVVHATNVT